MGKIIIKDLQADCIIGTNQKERSQKQPILINIELSLDLSKAARTDDLNDTVDYAKICEEIVQLAQNSNFYLLEKLADKVAKTCLDFDKVEKVFIRLEKPNAIKNAKSAAVEIELSK